jgi:hypothetical protein
MIVPSETSETDVPPGTNHTPKQLVPLSKAARSKFGLESWEAFPRLETTVLIGNGLFRLENGADDEEENERRIDAALGVSRMGV